MKNLLFFTLILISTFNYAQKLSSERNDIDKAQDDLKPLLMQFSDKLVTSDLDSSFLMLLQFNNGNLNEYHKYIIGCTFYDFDAEKSFKLIEEAYKARPDNYFFNYEYALALQRFNMFDKAKAIFERIVLVEEEDYRPYVYLAECEFNLGNVQKGIDWWEKANHPKRHTGIDKTIHTAHGRTDQMKKRNQWVKELKSGKLDNIEELIILDCNWEMDWWNIYTQEYFLNYDFQLVKQFLGDTTKRFKLLNIYCELKKASGLPKREKIMPLLEEIGFLEENKPLTFSSKIEALILSLCLDSYILEPRPFYNKRKNELLPLTEKTNIVEYLNILAYLQATIDGKVNPEIDRLGWKKYKDERFASSFLIGQGSSRCKKQELKEALNDFPLSSKIQCFALDCVKNDKKELKRFLLEIIKKEFQSLNAGPERYSYALKGYIFMLKDL